MYVPSGRLSDCRSSFPLGSLLDLGFKKGEIGQASLLGPAGRVYFGTLKQLTLPGQAGVEFT